MPRLSVILPVRNGADSIEAAVQSSLRALPPDAELVVLDDASTDDTADRVGRIDHPQLRLLHSEEGLGIAGGLNYLLDSTDSEFVARMDGDDVMFPWRLRGQQRMIARAGLAATFTNVIMWRPARKRFTPPAPTPISVDAFALHLLIRNPVAHPAMMARRRALESAGNYRNVPSEDYDLWLRLATAGEPMSRTLLPGLAYRLHEHQITASAAWRTSSWTDPRLLEAFKELSIRVLGVALPRMTTIAADINVSDDEFEATLATMSRAVIERSGKLNQPDRLILLRVLRNRLAFVRKIRSEAGQG